MLLLFHKYTNCLPFVIFILRYLALDTHTNVYLLLTQQHYATSTDKLIAYRLLLRNSAPPAPLINIYSVGTHSAGIGT